MNPKAIKNFIVFFKTNEPELNVFISVRRNGHRSETGKSASLVSGEIQEDLSVLAQPLHPRGDRPHIGVQSFPHHNPLVQLVDKHHRRKTKLNYVVILNLKP